MSHQCDNSILDIFHYWLILQIRIHFKTEQLNVNISDISVGNISFQLFHQLAILNYVSVDYYK